MDDARSGLTGRRAVITGAAGFIGSHLVSRLTRCGVVVDGVDLRPYPDWLRSLDPDFVSFHQRNILEPIDDLVAGADVVIHLAAEVSASRSVIDPQPDATANILGTLAVLESIRRAGGRRIVYASSSATYGTPRYSPIDEEHPTVPDSPYGLSKLSGERYVDLYRRLHGFNATSLRFFNVYGPHQPIKGGYTGVITLFLDQVKRGVALTIEGDGSHTRDFVHVDDVTRAVALAVSSCVPGIFNVGSGRAISIAGLADLIGGERYPRVFRPRRPGDIPHSVASVGAIRQALGFQSSVALADGLAQLRS